MALHDFDAKLRTITDNMPALIAYVDLEQRFRYANKFHEEWFGRSVVALTGQSMRDVLGVDEYECWRPHIQDALRGQRVTFEQRAIRNSGSSRNRVGKKMDKNA